MPTPQESLKSAHNQRHLWQKKFNQWGDFSTVDLSPGKNTAASTFRELKGGGMKRIKRTKRNYYEEKNRAVQEDVYMEEKQFYSKREQLTHRGT